MHKDLYFIPLFAEALAAPNARRALSAALERIAQLGQLEQYRRGFAQYQTWLTAFAAATERDTESPVVAELPWLHALVAFRGFEIASSISYLCSPRRSPRPTRGAHSQLRSNASHNSGS